MPRRCENVMTDPIGMDADQSHMTKTILDLTLEIVCLLTGEKYGVVKMASIDCLLQGLYPTMSGKLSSSIREPPPPTLILARYNEKKILEVTQKMMELLTGEVPIRCQEATMEECVEGHKDLYKDTMMVKRPPLTSPDLSESAQMLETYGAIKEELDCSEEERLLKEDVDYMKVRIEEEGPLRRDSSPYLDVCEIKENLFSEDEEHLEEKPPTEEEGTGNGTENGDETERIIETGNPSRLPTQSPEAKTHNCDGCGSVFTSSSDFLQHRPTCKGPRWQCGEFFGNEGTHQQMHARSKPYTCSKCGMSFGLKSLLVEHQRTHIKERSFACKECGKCFDQRSTLVKHLGTHSGEKAYLCSESGNHFSSSFGLTIRHQSHTENEPFVKSPTEEEPYICSVCGKCFDQRSTLMKHLGSHSREKAYLCSESGNDFGSSSGLVTQHRSPTESEPFVKSSSEEESYICSECGKCFSCNSLLISHQKSHCREQPYLSSDYNEPVKSQNPFLGSHQRTPTGVKSYSCSECGKCFSDSGHLTVHKRIHTGEKPYTCSECGKSFIQKSLLISHQRTHTGVKPYSCSECGKSYSQSGHLTVHKRVHSGEKPYTCSECGKSFYQRSLLIYHQRIHTGERPYSCKECGKCFTHRANLGVHQRIHLGEKPFLCGECGKSFINKWGLVNHRRTHTGERPYPCPECGKCFSRSPNLLRHRRVHLSES